MKSAIIYSSKTGNTQLLANVIKENIEEDCEYIGMPNTDVNAELYFVGSWVDKGNFDGVILEFLKTLKNKKIFLFGTAGFQNSKPYYDRILNCVKQSIDESNEIIGEYMCQGKMPIAVKEKYEAMDLANAKFNVSSFIENFDLALSHPDSEDLARLENIIKNI
ncbi:flavodoxin family protein BilS [Anaerorhabdus sp.]|uniref:flavodoxin family protein BilS n=1 Tax=Anaerorhabdus sp. TaxID=1872524 RepID=UPI002FC6DD35